MTGYTHIDKPVRIQVPGNKLIEEIVGAVRTQSDDVSIAHMVAPPGWSEPPQQPDFAETTVMVRGKMRVEVAGDTIDLKAGEAIRTEAGVRVRYTNPFDEECEYYAICVPAFTLERANRIED